MARHRYIDVYVPLGAGSDNGSGVGVVGAMAGLLGAVVGFAVVTCVVVSCTEFGASEIPQGPGCDPFCAATSTVTVPGVAR